MRERKQSGTIVTFSGRWYLRYYEPRLIDGVLVRKRVSHMLDSVNPRERKPRKAIRQLAACYRSRPRPKTSRPNEP